jgi:hypothetical protein
VVAACLAQLAAPRTALAQPSVGLPALPIPAFGGTVDGVRRDGNRLIVAGDFLGASPPADVRGGLSIHHAVSGNRSHDTTFIFGDVYTSIPDGAGGYYIGGRLYGVQSALRLGLAHLLPDGTLDQVFSAAISRNGGLPVVRSLALSGGVLFVGGEFDTVNGQVRLGLAAVSAVTGATLPFNPLAIDQSRAGTVRVLSIQAGTLYVGGAFTVIGGAARNSLAAFDVASAILLPWNPDVGGDVRDLLINGNTMYLGGELHSVGGQPRAYLAAVNLATGTPLPFSPTLWAGPVTALARIGDTLFVGGWFTGVLASGFQLRAHLAAFDIPTGGLHAWAPNPSEPVEGLTTLGTTLYAGGQFNYVGLPLGSPYRGGAAAFDWSAGGTLLPWNPAMNGTVFSLVDDGARVVLGGTFTAPNATPRRSVAIIDLTTLQLSPWQAPTVAGDADALGVVGNRIILGGETLDAVSGNGPIHRYMMVLDATSGVEVPWPQAPDGPVTAIETTPDRIYVSGLFEAAGTQTRRHVAAYDLAGALTPFVADTSGPVRTLQADATRLFIGGILVTVNGIPRVGVAAVDRFTGALDPLNVPVLSLVRTMAIEGGTLYVGGDIGVAGGLPRHGMAAIDLATATVLPWNPSAGNILPGPFRVDTMSVRGGRAFVGGPFNLVGTSPRRGFAMIEATGAVSGFDLYLHDDVWTSHVDDQIVVLGGGVDLAAGYSVSNLALFPAVVLATPGPPVNLQATITGNHVAFSWQPPPVGAAFTGYVLEAGLSPGTTFLSVPLGPGTSFEATAPSGAYWVRVRATGPSGPGPASNEVQLSVPSCVTPSVPGPLFGGVSGNIVTLVWQPSPGASVTHWIEAGSGPGLSDLGRFPVGGASSLGTQAPPGTYFVRVRAVTTCGVSAPSNEVVLTVAGATAPGPPGTPVASVNGNIVTLSWAAPMGTSVEGYILEVGSSPVSPSDLLVQDVGATTHLVTPAPPGRYFVRVRARNAAGSGPPSGQVVVDVR